MKAVLILLTLFCVGCASQSTPEFAPAHSRKVAVKLADGLGIVTMYVPERYDTGFIWTHDSDCNSCGHLKYRFQSSLWRIYEESGFFFYPPTDSVDRLTIVHSQFLDFDKRDTTWVYRENERFREKMEAYGIEPECYLIDTLCRIYDRPFSVTGDGYYLESVCRDFYELTAVTSVRGMAVAFEFELITDKKDSISEHFVQHALAVLQTVRFTEPKISQIAGTSATSR